MPLDLRRILQQALKASLASPLLFSCGPGVDTKPFDAIECDPGTSNISISKLMPAQGTDYAELRRIFMESSDMPQKLGTFGTRCGGASNPAACTSALDALKPSSGFGKSCSQICEELYLATTNGDDVASVTTLEALKAFLGTIDTPQEAVLLVAAQPFDLSCVDKSRGAVRKTEKGFEVVASRGFACGEGTAVTQHVLEVGSDGSLNEVSQAILERGKAGCAIGRRPCGLADAYVARAGDPLARHFAIVAHLEAASVPAFLRLRDELRLHGAPGALQVAAQLSAADEVRHARSMSAMARRFGGRAPSPRVRAMPLRPLAEVALDNAVEGCIRETYGALVAYRQALKAKDPAIAAELSTIAEDETRHASLSWEVHEWASRRLSRSERAGLKSAQAAAVRALREECAEPVDETVVEQAGMPPADEAVTLVDALSRTLWS